MSHINAHAMKEQLSPPTIATPDLTQAQKTIELLRPLMTDITHETFFDEIYNAIQEFVPLDPTLGKAIFRVRLEIFRKQYPYSPAIEQRLHKIGSLPCLGLTPEVVNAEIKNIFGTLQQEEEDKSLFKQMKDDGTVLIYSLLQELNLQNSDTEFVAALDQIKTKNRAPLADASRGRKNRLFETLTIISSLNSDTIPHPRKALNARLQIISNTIFDITDINDLLKNSED